MPISSACRGSAAPAPFTPYVPATESPAEFTLKAVVIGSLFGLLFGASTVSANTFARYPDFNRRRDWFIAHRPDLVDSVGPMVVPGPTNNLILGLVRPDQLRRMRNRLLDQQHPVALVQLRRLQRRLRDRLPRLRREQAGKRVRDEHHQ